MSPKILLYCGVNRGTSLLKQVNNFDLIIGFEPNPEAYSIAVQVFAPYKHVKLIPAALSEQAGVTEFQLYENDAVGSVKKLTSEWQDAHPNERQVFKQTINVPAIHLGEFIETLHFTEIDTLITDLQGYDLTIIKTVEKHIKNKLFKTIVCEVELNDVPVSYEGLNNKESDFDAILEPYYTKVARAGEAGWFTNDIQWKRTS
ncbi:FkbM family methyltransferase [bacterium]|nr:MAG: FkbM family methyltransferase [bacterium]